MFCLRRLTITVCGPGFVLSPEKNLIMAAAFRRFFSLGSESDENGDKGGQRKTRAEAIHLEKEKWMNMPKDEKREFYKCRSKYLDETKVPTWTEYFQEHGPKLLKLREKGKANAKKSKSSNPMGKKRNRDGEPAHSVYTANRQLNDKVSIWRGDITCLEIDAIVNAANGSLLGGGGVDGAIHSAAGSALRAECATLNGCGTGDAKTSGGYKLPAKYIIHTVGPMGFNPQKLEGAYTRCLEEAEKYKARTVAFPCISTGIYGYPNDDACERALGIARSYLESEKGENVDRIIFCLFMPVDVKLYEELMQVYFPIPSEDLPQQAVEEKGEKKHTGMVQELEDDPKESDSKPETEKDEDTTVSTDESKLKKAQEKATSTPKPDEGDSNVDKVSCDESKLEEAAKGEGAESSTIADKEVEGDKATQAEGDKVSTQSKEDHTQISSGVAAEQDKALGTAVTDSTDTSTGIKDHSADKVLKVGAKDEALEVKAKEEVLIDNAKDITDADGAKSVVAPTEEAVAIGSEENTKKPVKKEETAENLEDLKCESEAVYRKEEGMEISNEELKEKSACDKKEVGDQKSKDSCELEGASMTAQL